MTHFEALQQRARRIIKEREDAGLVSSIDEIVSIVMKNMPLVYLKYRWELRAYLSKQSA